MSFILPVHVLISSTEFPVPEICKDCIMLNLKEIDPESSEIFSPNLHSWLLKDGRVNKDGSVAVKIFRIQSGSKLAKLYGDNTLMIGSFCNRYNGDTEFSGALLKSVLCLGNGIESSRYSDTGSLKVVDGFWDRYKKDGRASITSLHLKHFVPRNSVIGTRVCMWCGAAH